MELVKRKRKEVIVADVGFSDSEATNADIVANITFHHLVVSHNCHIWRPSNQHPREGHGKYILDYHTCMERQR